MHEDVECLTCLLRSLVRFWTFMLEISAENEKAMFVNSSSLERVYKSSINFLKVLVLKNLFSWLISVDNKKP